MRKGNPTIKNNIKYKHVCCVLKPAIAKPRRQYLVFKQSLNTSSYQVHTNHIFLWTGRNPPLSTPCINSCKKILNKPSSNI